MQCRATNCIFGVCVGVTFFHKESDNIQTTRWKLKGHVPSHEPTITKSVLNGINVVPAVIHQQSNHIQTAAFQSRFPRCHFTRLYIGIAVFHKVLNNVHMATENG